jgi:hypothetical protein
MLWLASRSKSRTVYKPLPLGMGFMTQDFAQKTRFLGPSTLRTATQKPGFLPNLSALTKNLGKNPVSRPLPLSATQKPGFYQICGFHQESWQKPGFSATSNPKSKID